MTGVPLWARADPPAPSLKYPIVARYEPVRNSVSFYTICKTSDCSFKRWCLPSLDMNPSQLLDRWRLGDFFSLAQFSIYPRLQWPYAHSPSILNLVLQSSSHLIKINGDRRAFNQYIVALNVDLISIWVRLSVFSRRRVASWSATPERLAWHLKAQFPRNLLVRTKSPPADARANTYRSRAPCNKLLTPKKIHMWEAPKRW